MVHAVTAVIIIIAILLLYGATMLFTDYIKVASYINAILINLVWFYIGTGNTEYNIFYPTIFEIKWLNLLFMTVTVLFLVFELSKFIKLRNAFLISSGTLLHLIVAILVLNFCGGAPGWMAAVYIGVSSCIIVGVYLISIYGGNNTAPAHFFSRLLAGILVMPSPFMIVSACMVAASSNQSMVIEAVSFDEFIHRLYDFIKNPDFNYSGKILFTDVEYTRKIFLMSLIAAFAVLVIYVIADSTVDFRSERKLKNKHKKEAEKERIRKELSVRIHTQFDKIDSCMAYISTNYKFLKIDESEMKLLRGYYDEATRIKYSYNGAASGPILKRLTEIKTEMFVIRDMVVNRTEQQRENRTNNDENPEWTQNAENRTEKNDIPVEKEKSGTSSGFFNGCTNVEELKKRYRDLTKVFHPDSENGDQETFMTIKEDYEMLLERFSS